MKIADLPPKHQREAREQLYANPPSRPLPHPEPQRYQTSALGAANEGKGEGIPRTIVRFVGYRTRPLDPDNFAGGVKDLLDGLRHAELISGDEPWKIKLETEQVKVAHRNEERTEITITYP